MDNVDEIVALLRKQADLENQILNGPGTAVATERELEATRRRRSLIPRHSTPSYRPPALYVARRTRSPSGT